MAYVHRAHGERRVRGREAGEVEVVLPVAPCGKERDCDDADELTGYGLPEQRLQESDRVGARGGGRMSSTTRRGLI